MGRPRALGPGGQPGDLWAVTPCLSPSMAPYCPQVQDQALSGLTCLLCFGPSAAATPHWCLPPLSRGRVPPVPQRGPFCLLRWAASPALPHLLDAASGNPATLP